MNERFTEGDFEQALIELFSGIGYSSKTGSEIERDLSDPFDRSVLYESLSHVNPRMPQEAIEEAVRIISNINDGTLEQRNEQFMEYLQNGVEVSIYEDGAPKSYIVRLISFNKHGANTMELVDQFTFVEHDKIRCDLVVFVNGLPLVVIELKSPSRSETSIEDAFKQIKQYQQKCPSLFVYNAFSVISDMTTSKAGTITSPEDRFMEWKSKDGNYESTAVADYRTFFEGIFYRTNLLDILKNFICFDHKDGKSVKVMGAYHQYFAVNKAFNSIMSASERNDGKGGVFWHTQGSGKSFSMVFLAHRLILEAPGVTLLVVTDRNDLDQQLYEQFSGCSKFLRQDAQHVGHDLNEKGKLVKSQEGGRADLKKKLKDLEQGGIIFTTIQKFEEETGLLSERRNIIVITDTDPGIMLPEMYAYCILHCASPDILFLCSRDTVQFGHPFGNGGITGHSPVPSRRHRHRTYLYAIRHAAPLKLLGEEPSEEHFLPFQYGFRIIVILKCTIRQEIDLLRCISVS